MTTIKKTIIGCNKFADTNSISNSNWSTSLKKELTINSGDTVSVKTSFIDTRNKSAGYYSIPKDLIISMDYYFYYINRGGNQTPSSQVVPEQPPYPNPQYTQPQMYACDTPQPGQNIRNGDLFPTFGQDPQSSGNVYPSANDNNIVYSQYKNNFSPAYKNTIPITNDTTATGKIPANLSPLIESVYHTYGNLNSSLSIFNNLSAYANNPSGFNSVLDIASGDGLPYLLHYYIPENLLKHYVPQVLPYLSSMVIGTSYSISKLGNPYKNGYDTDWLQFSNTLTNPQLKQNFVCQSNVLNHITFNNDVTGFDLVNEFVINSSIGYDWSAYGGSPILPVVNNPIFPMIELLNNNWYRFTGSITPKFSDGTTISDYTNYCGMPANTQPVVGTQFVSNSNAADFQLLNLAGILGKISPGMQIRVNTQGLINWDLLGYSNTNPIIDITDAQINTLYKITSVGNTWGVNNQFLQSNLPNNNVNNLFKITSPYTPTVYNFPVLNLSQLNASYNGEYFILNNVGNDDIWQSFFESVSPEFTQGSIIKAKFLTTPMPTGLSPTVTMQWFQIASIPINSTILVESTNAETGFQFGNIGGNGNIGEQTFTTTNTITEYELSLYNFNGDGNDLKGSFSYVEPNNEIQLYVLQTPFTFITSSYYPNPQNITDTTYQAVLLPTDQVQQINNYLTFPLIRFKPTIIPVNTVYNSSFSAHVVSTGEVSTENLATNVYNNREMLTGPMIPFTKKWKFKIKAGSYSPEYLAEIISRAMSYQRPKTNIRNGKITVSTPIVNINEQMIDRLTEINYIYNNPNIQLPFINGYQGLTAFIRDAEDPSKILNVQNNPSGNNQPFLHQGGFPYNAIGQIDTWANMDMLWQSYTPNNQFVPKNINLLPEGKNLDNASLPLNPKYSQNDFNYNASLTGDDTPFIYRPNAYGTRCDFDPTLMNIKLTYNDANLQYLNDYMREFGTQEDGSIRNIEMAYKPLCSDAQSDFFSLKQYYLTEITQYTNDYSIRPVVSVPGAQLAVNMLNQSTVNNYTSSVASMNRNLASPLVGATEMSLTFNDENNNLFSFPYLHSGIYSKPDPTANQTVESVAIYPNTTYLIPGVQIPTSYNDPIRVPSVFQCSSQSGILLKNLSAEYVDGTQSTFWEDLGFDLNAITVNNNKSTVDIDTFQITYDEFISKSTRAFSGTANIYDTQTKNDFSEIAPISFYDSYTLSGWQGQPIFNTTSSLINGYTIDFFIKNYIPYSQPLYFSVEKTVSIDAKNTFSNLNDTGHILLSIEGYSGELINSETVLNIKSIISSYYSSANFITNPNSESIVYEHIGEPLQISNLKIVLIDPYTNQEVENIGNNSSIYLEITQQLAINK